MAKSKSQFFNLLHDVRTQGKDHTHVLLGYPYGCYNAGARMEDFITYYMDEYKKGTTQHTVAENPGSESPVLVDIDLKVKVTSLDRELQTGEHLYTQAQLLEVVDGYQTAIKSIALNHEGGYAKHAWY